jgi:thiosulfate dehydrogenase [quinone] large subunit
MKSYSKTQTFWLIALRMLIGWHFLYEGIVKVLNPKWTSLAYLTDSKGWFAPFFHNLAASQSTVNTIDFLNEWGLVLIGLGLMVGCLTRIAAIGGMVLLAFYYLSHPPFIGSEYLLPSEGAYLWINKNLIELVALGVLCVFPTEHVFGLDYYICKFKTKSKSLLTS